MNRIGTRSAWQFSAAAAIVVAAMVGATGAVSAADAEDATTITRGDLVETMSWTGDLAYSHQTSLTYKSGSADAEAPAGGALGFAASVGARLDATLQASPTVLAARVRHSLVAAATPTPSPSASPSATPSPSPTPDPSPSPSTSPTPTGGPGATPPADGGQVPCPCLGANTVRGGGTATGDAGTDLEDAANLVTWLPAPGSVVANGGTLYRVNNQPVVLIDGGATLYRNLEVGDHGDDVLALESALAALGYGSDMTVDGTFTAVTARQLKAFQNAVGLEATGVLDATTVVMHDGAVAIATLVASIGDAASTGTEILVIGDTQRDVTFAIDPAQRTALGVGDTVTVTLLDGSVVGATVTFVASAPSEDGSYAVTARLDPAVAVSGDHLAVAVGFTRTLATDALLVDPYALVLLEGNRTVVRVVRDEGVVDVEVTVLATAGRSTAVTGEGLAEGDVVQSS